jgi:hypothetical protein
MNNRTAMKASLLVLAAAFVLLFTSACSSGVRVGTKHHYVAFRSSAG